MAAGYDLKTESGIKEYLRDVEIEYQFQCLDQKEIDGCHRLAEFQENIRKNPSAAAPIYKNNCDNNNYSRSCFKYGQFLHSGQGVETKDLKSASQYYEKSCRLGHGGGCFYAGLQLVQGGGDGTTNQKAVDLLSQSCDLKCSKGCFVTASWYLQGRHTAKDLKKAFEYNQKGCNLDDIGCCSNLSIMYRHGHGTEKNLALADEIKKKADKLSPASIAKQPVLKVNE
ncbi:Cytochrome c oxidase assembly factor 7 [Bulinus truncatus]|nr:Cytochrome c oxidase assembly factor 7 [Bulinus truncatus]